MASLESLTDGEIRTKLTELGCPVGPVTSTTRKVLLKKLKLLLEQASSQKKSKLQYDPQCSITQFSSGDESDEGTPKGRRKSMPPPKTTKSPRKRTPTRSPLANSTVLETSQQPASIEDEGSTHSIIHSRRSTRYSVGTHDLPSYRSPLKSEFKINSDLSDSSRISPSSRGLDNTSPMGNNLSFTTGTSSLFRLGLKTNEELDDFKSRTPQTRNNYSSQTPLYKSTQPYSSEFARRLSSLTSNRNAASSSTITRKMLDVKESDDEDNGSIPAYAKFSHSNVKGIQNLQPRTNGRGVFGQESWFSYDSPISAVLVVSLLLFFIMIGATYVNMHSVDTNVIPTTEIKYPLCSHKDLKPGVNCILDKDMQIVTKMFKTIHRKLNDVALNRNCLKSVGPFSDAEVTALLTEEMNTFDVELNLKNLKVLINSNPEWNINENNNGIFLSDPPITTYCYLYSKLMIAVNWIMKLSAVIILLYIFYKTGKWWLLRNAKYKEEVYKLVNNIIEVVSSKAQETNGFVPISHVRDQLLLPKDRHRMRAAWDEAVSILESDSRLRLEIQNVEGEEFAVWRWLAAPSQPGSTNSQLGTSSKKKVWQGQAFETVEGSVNSLPESPTAYLKIRHMFDATVEEGSSWVVTVANAILEKCGEAKILHMVVDKQSREGCVYMKCSSPRDAGIAYRALHGSWFDGKLVTVKYIREKRYLERFPESIGFTEPLPSNDMKISLQD